MSSNNPRSLRKTADNRSPMGLSERGQTNIDYIISLLILLVFISGTVFFTGSPLYTSQNSDLDYTVDAQRMLVDLEYNTLTGEDGDVSSSLINSFVASGNVSGDLRLEEGLNANVSFEPVGSTDPASIFNNASDVRSAGEPIPNTVTSSADNILMVDNREVKITLTIWRDL